MELPDLPNGFPPERKANFFLKACVSKIGGLSFLWFNVIAAFLPKYYASIVDNLGRQVLSFI